MVGAAVLSRTPNTLGSAIWGKGRALAELAVLLLAGGAAMALAISRLVTFPLAAVVAQARAVAEGGRMTPLARPGTREVAALSATLARMEATLAQRAGYISGFAASVSHEFKAPLAAIRGAGELLDDHCRQPVGCRADPPAAPGGAMAWPGWTCWYAAWSTWPRAEHDARHAARRAGRRAGTGAGRGWPGGRLPCPSPAPGRPHVTLGEDALQAVLAALVDNAAVHAPGAALRIHCRAGGWPGARDGRR